MSGLTRSPRTLEATSPVRNHLRIRGHLGWAENRVGSWARPNAIETSGREIHSGKIFTKISSTIGSRRIELARLKIACQNYVNKTYEKRTKIMYKWSFETPGKFGRKKLQFDITVQYISATLQHKKLNSFDRTNVRHNHCHLNYQNLCISCAGRWINVFQPTEC